MPDARSAAGWQHLCLTFPGIGDHGPDPETLSLASSKMKMLIRLSTLALFGAASVGFWDATGVNSPAAFAARIANHEPWVRAMSLRVRTDSMDPTTLLTVAQGVSDRASALLLLAVGLGALLAFTLANRQPSPALQVARTRQGGFARVPPEGL